MELSIQSGDAAQGQVVGHGIAARGGGIGRGGRTSFQFSVFRKTAREDARPTDAKAEGGKRKAEIVGGGGGNGVSQVSPARLIGENRRSGGARNGGPAS